MLSNHVASADGDGNDHFSKNKWSCIACTFSNTEKMHPDRCEMCFSHRQRRKVMNEMGNDERPCCQQQQILGYFASMESVRSRKRRKGSVGLVTHTVVTTKGTNMCRVQDRDSDVGTKTVQITIPPGQKRRRDENISDSDVISIDKEDEGDIKKGNGNRLKEQNPMLMDMQDCSTRSHGNNGSLTSPSASQSLSPSSPLFSLKSAPSCQSQSQGIRSKLKVRTVWIDKKNDLPNPKQKQKSKLKPEAKSAPMLKTINQKKERIMIVPKLLKKKNNDSKKKKSNKDERFVDKEGDRKILKKRGKKKKVTYDIFLSSSSSSSSSSSCSSVSSYSSSSKRTSSTYSQIVSSENNQLKKKSRKPGSVKKEVATKANTISMVSSTSSYSHSTSYKKLNIRNTESYRQGGGEYPSRLHQIPGTAKIRTIIPFDRLWDRSMKVMKEKFHIESLRNLQGAVVKSALRGRHQVVVMATGAGKSLWYVNCSRGY